MAHELASVAEGYGWKRSIESNRLTDFSTMTTSSTSGLSVKEAREMLRGATLRATACRLAVLQYLSQSDMPISHAEVADELVPSGYDKSTIYRSLIEFVDAGLAARLDLGDHVWRFELRSESGQQHAEHPHFMCLSCGGVECLADVKVTIAPKKGAGKRSIGEVTEVLLKGHCPSCR
jgi:Fur family ferric uptake transcriptional regulator